MVPALADCGQAELVPPGRCPRWRAKPLSLCSRVRACQFSTTCQEREKIPLIHPQSRENIAECETPAVRSSIERFEFIRGDFTMILERALPLIARETLIKLSAFHKLAS